MGKALISQGFSVWHLNRPQHLAVPNHLDATLFFEKRAKINDFLLFFKKFFQFDKLELVYLFYLDVNTNKTGIWLNECFKKLLIS